MSHNTSFASRDQSVLVVVDVQEKLHPLMQDAGTLAARIETLMRGASLLGLPVLVTEQYVKGLGRTIAPLRDAVHATFLEKSTFSCGGDEGFMRALRETERTQVVLCGIEAHICVMQTALALLADGYDVFLVEDAVDARLPHTAAVGIARMRAAGARPTTVEGVLFELMQRCDDESFKAILPLVREGR